MDHHEAYLWPKPCSPVATMYATLTKPRGLANLLLHAASERAMLCRTTHPLTLTPTLTPTLTSTPTLTLILTLAMPLPHTPCLLKGSCLLARLLPPPLGGAAQPCLSSTILILCTPGLCTLERTAAAAKCLHLGHSCKCPKHISSR